MGIYIKISSIFCTPILAYVTNIAVVIFPTTVLAYIYTGYLIDSIKGVGLLVRGIACTLLFSY